MEIFSQLACKLREMDDINMRKAGIIILIVGLIITMITGFNYVTKETIVKMGELEITTDRTHSTDWSPMAGFAVMAAGGVVYLVGGKER